jgi:beta-glucosidase
VPVLISRIAVRGSHPVPWGFRELLRHCHERYLVADGIPLWVTENGFANAGEANWTREEQINDTQRQDYYAGYLKELAEAVKEDGIKVEGYMAWSLLE